MTVSMGTPLSERLRKAREQAKFKSPTEAARRFGWTVSTYYAHENGQNGFRQPTAARYARAFRVNVGWLLTGEGKMVPDPPVVVDSPSALHTIPQRPAEQSGIVIPEIDVRLGAGAGGLALETFALSPDGDEYYAADEVKAQWELPVSFVRNELRSNGRAVRLAEVLGDSMEPTLRSGDRVLVDTEHRAPSPPGVYALWDGYGMVVKRIELVRGSEPVSIEIISDNPHHKPYRLTLEEANIVGRVICRVSPM